MFGSPPRIFVPFVALGYTVAFPRIISASSGSDQTSACFRCDGRVPLDCAFGVMGLTEPGFPGWVVVKMVCWFVLTSLPPMAFRMMRHKVSLLSTIAAATLTIAIVMASINRSSAHRREVRERQRTPAFGYLSSILP